jgi:hypothetical protein
MYSMTPVEQVPVGKARYCRYADTKQWEGFSALFVAAPEILIYDAADQLIVSFDTREAFAAACRGYLEGTQPYTRCTTTSSPKCPTQKSAPSGRWRIA